MHKTRILIVEDELIIAEDLAVTLKEKGYTIIGTVSSIGAAVEICRATKPDLIIIDLNLRGTKSIRKAAQLIQKEFDVLVICLTTDGRDSPTASLDPSPCVGKPFTEKALLATIEMVLNERRRNPE